MVVSEIFRSIQGEGTLQGEVCTFVRLTGCNLRCLWCDTKYAYSGKTIMTVRGILAQVQELGCGYVTVTGGEPLIHKDIGKLLSELKRKKFFVSVFTNGTIDVKPFMRWVDKFVVDYKLPSAGESRHFFRPNWEHLRKVDELKFVIADQRDYDTARDVLKHGVTKATILLSPCLNGKSLVSAEKLAVAMIEHNIPARFSLQIHKVLFGKQRHR